MAAEGPISMKNIESKRLLLSAVIPATIVIAIVIVFLLQYTNIIVGYKLGIYPRQQSGLLGIALAPFLHSDWSHLLSNIVSLFILATGVFYFYRDLGILVLLVCWVVGGSLTWALGRDSFHIGASGLVYGLASFLFFSGVVRQNIQLLAVSLIVVIQYGSLVWGILPSLKEISFESHIYGGAAGFVLAIVLQNKGPRLPQNVWNRDFPDDDETPDYWSEEQELCENEDEKQ